MTGIDRNEFTTDNKIWFIKLSSCGGIGDIHVYLSGTTVDTLILCPKEKGSSAVQYVKETVEIVGMCHSVSKIF